VRRWGQDDFVLDIPEDERLSVLTGIDSMLKDDHTRRDEGALRFIPTNRSFTLPLILNLGALVVLVVGAFVLFRVFDRSESALVSPDAQLVSAEGRILDRLKRDAEAELSEKNRQISEIQSLLSDLESQQDLLTAQTEAQFADREAELRNEFQAALEDERNRLSEIGVSGDNLTAAMSAFEAEARNRFDAELAEVESNLEAERAQRAAELEAQRTAYEQQIAAADAERSRIEEELQSRTVELEEQAAARSAEAGEAARQLENLQARRQQEQLVTDQILAYYDRVGEARSVGDYQRALEVLTALEGYLKTGGIRDSGVVEARRDVDTFLVDALRRLVQLEAAPDAVVELQEDTESANLLTALAEGALIGTQLYEAGNEPGARQAWQEAFSAVPELAEAFDAAYAAGGTTVTEIVPVASPEELAAARAEGREAGLSEGLTRGRELGRTEALSQENAVVENLRSQLESLNSRIGNIAERYKTALIRTEDDETSYRSRLVDLLDQKLSIKADLDPSLHRSLDDYTDATGDLRELEGRKAVYEEIVRFLEDLENGE
jgi:hypothetical protein